MLIQHLPISAGDRPGIIGKWLLQEAMRTRERTPRTLGFIVRAFGVYMAYLQDLSEMCGFQPAELEVSVDKAADETTHEQHEHQGAAVLPPGMSRLCGSCRGGLGL